MKKKVTAILLAAVLCLSSVQAPAFAANGDGSPDGRQEPTATTTVTVSASDFTVDSGTTQHEYYYNTHGTGDTATVKYTGDGSFHHWKDGNGMNVSNDKAFSFPVLHPVDLTAIETVQNSGVGMVVFYTEFEQVLSAQSYSSSETINFPADLNHSGKVFVGWDHTEAQIKAEIASGADFVAVHPVFESAQEYTISVYYRTESGDELQEERTVGSGESALFTAPESYNGLPFVCWVKNGDVISYNTSCSFFVLADAEIYALFGDSGELAPTVTLSGSVGEEDGIFHFDALRAVPETVTMIEHGIIVVTSDSFGHDTPANRERANAALTISGDGVKVYRFTAPVYYGNDRINLNPKGKDKTIYAKGYVTYTNGGTGITVYSDMVVLTNVTGQGGGSGTPQATTVPVYVKGSAFTVNSGTVQQRYYYNTHAIGSSVTTV